MQCPECGSDHVQFLTIGPFNPYMYGCRDCRHQWEKKDLEKLEKDNDEKEASEK